MNSIYKSSGAVVVKGLIPPLIQKAIAVIESIFHDEGLSGSLEDMIVILNNQNQPLLHKLHLKTSKLDIFKPIENVCSDVFKELLGSAEYHLVGNTAGYLLGLPADSRLVYDFHQECHYMKGITPILTAHFPLNVACTPVNGAMSYLNNSSILGPLPYKKSRISNGYTNLLPDGITNIVTSHKEVQPELSVGDCLFFDEYCIHKSNYNSSKRPRLCGIFRVTI